MQPVDIQKTAPPQNELQLFSVKELKTVGVAPMKEALMKSIDKILVEAFKLGFHSANASIKRAFIRFTEIVLVEVVHQNTPSPILTKDIDGPLSLVSLVSALVESIGQQSPHSHAIPIRSISRGQI